MADSLTISDLPPVEEVLISQVMAIEDSENTQQVTIDQLRKFINQYLVEIIDANFDEQKNEGIYKLTGAITNAPASNDAAYILKVVKNGAAIVQTAYSIDLAGQYPTTFRRRWDGLTWSSWTDSKRSYTPWAINSGKQTVKGENGIMNGVGTIAVTFDTSVPMFCTVANGSTYEIKSVPPFQFEVDGTYNVFYDPIQNDVQAFTNKINIQNAAPESPNRNDVWLNTSQTPLVFSFWDTVKWTEINYIFMGTVTVTSGNITEIKNRNFNVNSVYNKASIVFSGQVSEDFYITIDSNYNVTVSYLTLNYGGMPSGTTKVLPIPYGKEGKKYIAGWLHPGVVTANAYIEGAVLHAEGHYPPFPYMFMYEGDHAFIDKFLTEKGAR